MDFYRNVSVAGEFSPEQVLSSPCSKLGATLASGSLDDLFSAQNTEVDVSLEWLSIFVEDCFSSTGNYIPVAAATTTTTTTSTNVQNESTTTIKPTKTLQQNQKPQQQQQQKQKQNASLLLQKFTVPGKARSKRKRISPTSLKTRPFSGWSNFYSQNQNQLHLTSSDPPLLQQAYWLADSELIVPTKQHNCNIAEESKKELNHLEEKRVTVVENHSVQQQQQQQQQPRRCSHCLAQRTPQWRAGPLGPKTLCNACGVRYKSGRLLPEYRPAKSPTFVSYLHSNSHKKVMEMRMSLLSSSIPSEQG